MADFSVDDIKEARKGRVHHVKTYDEPYTAKSYAVAWTDERTTGKVYPRSMQADCVTVWQWVVIVRERKNR